MTLQTPSGITASGLSSAPTTARSPEAAPQSPAYAGGHSAAQTAAALGAGIPVHRAEDLTRGGQLANIVLDGKVYSLRITRAGKLILTK